MTAAKRHRMKSPTSAEDSWIYGVHAVRAALSNARRRCRRLVTTTENAEDTAVPEGVTCEIVSRSDIDRLLPTGVVHQGIAGQFDPLPPTELEELLATLRDEPAIALLVLDQVTDPRNVGAILRSAAAFGCRGVVVQERHSPPLSGALLKAASGGAELVPLIRVGNLAQSLDTLKHAGFWCLGFDVEGGKTIQEAGLGGRVALVLGAEGRGLRRLTKDRCDHLVRIPIGGAVESLNVAVSAAIALYEWSRAA